MTLRQKWISFFIGGVLFCALYFVFLAKETHVIFVPREEATGTIEGSINIPNQKNKSIFLLSPRSRDTLKMPFVLSGIARAFENTIQVEIIKKETGELVIKKSYITNAEEPSFFGDFSIPFEEKELCDGETELQATIFVESPKDGARMDEETISFFCGEKGGRQINVYFENVQEEGEISCEKVFATKRIIPQTSRILEATLQELLKGPDAKEKEAGFITSIPSGVTLKSVILKNATATIDLSSDLSQYGGGSCRVGLIRKEFEETAKQFGTVKDVLLQVEGKTEGVLEP